MTKSPGEFRLWHSGISKRGVSWLVRECVGQLLMVLKKTGRGFRDLRTNLRGSHCWICLAPWSRTTTTCGTNITFPRPPCRKRAGFSGGGVLEFFPRERYLFNLFPPCQAHRFVSPLKLFFSLSSYHIVLFIYISYLHRYAMREIENRRRGGENLNLPLLSPTPSLILIPSFPPYRAPSLSIQLFLWHRRSPTGKAH